MRCRDVNIDMRPREQPRRTFDQGAVARDVDDGQLAAGPQPQSRKGFNGARHPAGRTATLAEVSRHWPRHWSRDRIEERGLALSPPAHAPPIAYDRAQRRRRCLVWRCRLD
jgi:hypothetical protein